jgi:hypothetical protein
VEPVDLTSNRQAQKFDALLWHSPNVNSKVFEDEGFAYAYIDGQAKLGAYCNAYAKDGSGTRFSRMDSLIFRASSSTSHRTLRGFKLSQFSSLLSKAELSSMFASLTSLGRSIE